MTLSVDLLYAVSGKSALNGAVGYTFNTSNRAFGRLLAMWKPKEFGEPHDLTLSVDGRSLFVGEIRPNRIQSFDNVH